MKIQEGSLFPTSEGRDMAKHRDRIKNRREENSVWDMLDKGLVKHLVEQKASVCVHEARTICAYPLSLIYSVNHN